MFAFGRGAGDLGCADLDHDRPGGQAFDGVDECGEVFGLTAEAVRRIEVPTLLIYGSRSPFLASFEFLRAALPCCTPHLVSGAGHLTHQECAALVGTEIVRFLAEGRAPAPAVAAGVAADGAWRG